jgi:hypothetical protein
VEGRNGKVDKDDSATIVLLSSAAAILTGVCKKLSKESLKTISIALMAKCAIAN